MDGEWEDVKSKKVNKPKPQQQANQKGDYGGKGKNGKLVAGAVEQVSSKYGGGGAWGSSKQAVNNQAQNIGDYDYNIDGDEEVKYETVSHKCASSVQSARIGANMTQTQLAKAVNEKSSAIVDIENGTARYNAGLINAIEKATGAKIDRGRASKKSNNKKKY